MVLPYSEVFSAGGDAADRDRHEWSMRTGRALAVHIAAYLREQLASQGFMQQPFTYWLKELFEHFTKGGSPALSSLLMLKCVFGGSIRYAGIEHANAAGWALITDQAGGTEQLQALQQVRAMSGDVHMAYMPQH
jgi:hypothetical protein